VDHLPAKQELPAIFFRVNFKHHNMKPLFYIGAALMIGAGIYGFVDYKKKNQSKEFQSLYREEPKKEVQEPVTADVAPPPIPAPVVTEKIETVVVDKKTSSGSKQVVSKKRKKLNAKLYSRAALEEEVMIVEEPEKKTGQ
jgi:hypothetical protein